MKRFLFLSMLVFIAVMIGVSIHEKEDDMPFPQKLERAMRLTQMEEHQDDDYDYIVRHPSFFEQTEDSLMEKGCCRFSFGRTAQRLCRRHLWNKTPIASPLNKRWLNTPLISMRPTGRKATTSSFSQATFLMIQARLQAAATMPSSYSTASFGSSRRWLIQKIAKRPSND